MAAKHCETSESLKLENAFEALYFCMCSIFTEILERGQLLEPISNPDLHLKPLKFSLSKLQTSACHLTRYTGRFPFSQQQQEETV